MKCRRLCAKFGPSAGHARDILCQIIGCDLRDLEIVRRNEDVRRMRARDKFEVARAIPGV